jgi:VCBS repeat-containing protein
MAVTRVFIDSRVKDKELLISQFAPGTEYQVLDANRDGIEQLVTALSGQSGYDSIQIISHGAPGSITIGSTVLNSSTLGSYAAELALLGNALTENGDLLLYGCNVAAGDQGQHFIETLSQMTGADVAASDDPTGGTVAGGDWVLEVQVGSVEQTATVDAMNYGYLLANSIPTVSGPLVTTVAEGDAPVSLNLLANAHDADLADTLRVGNVTYTVNGVPSALPAGITLNGITLTIDPSNTAYNALAQGDQKTIVATYQVLDSPATVAEMSFAPKVDYATGSYPISVTSADVNGDGKFDLIIANVLSKTVSVLMNNGDGTFAAKIDYATGYDPCSVTSADVNGDGKFDTIFVNTGSNTVSVLKNSGDGTFVTRVDYSTGKSPYSVVIADLNGDGKSDLIVANWFSNTVSVLKNNGDGTFVTKVDYETGSGPLSVTSADVNGDGKSDLIIANHTSNTVSVLKNNGDGTFVTKVDYETGSWPESVTSADVNVDGNSDLIVANSGSDTVSVLKNSGDGTFVTKVDYATGSYPKSVTSEDVDGDGKSDLVVVNNDSHEVSVLKNNGDGTFATKVDYVTGSYPKSVTSADVNSDGKSDLIVANYFSHTVSVLINNSTGFSAYPTTTETITINGTNDAPVVTNSAEARQGSVTEAGHLVDGSVTASGTLTASDVDAGVALTWSIADTPPKSIYGIIAIDATTGVWTYTLDNAKAATEALHEGETVTQSYIARVTDEFGAYADQTVTVTIHGTNDAPVAVADVKVTNGPSYIIIITWGPDPFSGDDSPLLHHHCWWPDKLTVSGAAGILINDTDPDTNDTHSVIAVNGSAENVGQSVPGDHGGIFTINSDGSYTFDPQCVDYYDYYESGLFTINSDGSYTLVPPDDVVYLKGGLASMRLPYPTQVSYTISDNHGGVSSSTLTVTVNGTNDAPVVDATDVTGAVTELVTPIGNLTDSGTIGFTDVDLSDSHTVSAVTASAGALGALTSTITTDTTGTGLGGVVTWNYSVDSAAVEYLAEGEHKVESFTFSILDGHGGSTERTVDVVITGTIDGGAFDLAGAVTFWKSGAAIAGVTSTLDSAPAATGSQLIEFRTVQVAADGTRTIEIWETSAKTNIESLQLELTLPDGSMATWADAAGLPSGWNSLSNTENAGQFILGGMGTTALSAGPVKLGTLTLTAPTNPQHFDLSLTSGELGTDSVPAFGIVSDSMTTGIDGLYQHLGMADGTYALTSAKVSGTAEATAIKANDALAALKIAVGMNPNADGSDVSPYQYLAADVNQDGQVKAADALNILKMAVKLDTAPAKEWLFVPDSVGSESMTRTTVIWPDNPLSVTLDIDQELNLIGIVKGDVNGSWAA